MNPLKNTASIFQESSCYLHSNEAMPVQEPVRKRLKTMSSEDSEPKEKKTSHRQYETPNSGYTVPFSSSHMPVILAKNPAEKFDFQGTPSDEESVQRRYGSVFNISNTSPTDDGIPYGKGAKNSLEGITNKLLSLMILQETNEDVASSEKKTNYGYRYSFGHNWGRPVDLHAKGEVNNGMPPMDWVEQEKEDEAIIANPFNSTEQKN